MKILAFILISASLTIAPARAQQTTGNIFGNQFPAGISVLASGTVAISSWLQTNQFTARTFQEAGLFERAVNGAGLSVESIALLPAGGSFTNSPPGIDVVVTAQPDRTPRLRALAHLYHLTANQTQFVPADADALYRQALALAIGNARQQADAIAAADHQHAGRMIDFTPSPLEFARSLATASASPPLMGISPTGYIVASAIVTFAIIP